MGEGRWVSTDAKKKRGFWKGIVLEGCWQSGSPHGYSVAIQKSGVTTIAEYVNGQMHGLCIEAQ